MFLGLNVHCVHKNHKKWASSPHILQYQVETCTDLNKILHMWNDIRSENYSGFTEIYLVFVDI